MFELNFRVSTLADWPEGQAKPSREQASRWIAGVEAFVRTSSVSSPVNNITTYAKSVGIKLTIDDFQAVSDKTPFLAGLKPSGKYVMYDMYKIGDTPVLLRFLLKEELIDGSGITVTGKTMKENVASCLIFLMINRSFGR